jgi:excisionase family DNA binding protein
MDPSELAKKKYITVADVASVLGVTTRTVRRWCASGAMTAAQGCRRGTWRIPIAAIREQFAQMSDDLRASSLTTDITDMF